MQLVSSGALTPVIKILTDYPRDDLAHDEVQQALVTACLKFGIKPYNLDVGAVPGMDTVVAGFKTAQLALNSKLGFGHIFHTNCAPRKNIISVKSQGEKIVLGITRSGVALLLVNAGYTLAPFKSAAEKGDITFFQTSVPDSGSQFRSRDFFPAAVAELAAHFTALVDQKGSDAITALLEKQDYTGLLQGLSFAGDPVPVEALPQLAQGSVFYIDNFGNIKLNLKHKDLLALYPAGTVLTVSIGGSVSEAVTGDVGFSQGEGVLALTSGSSGWGDDFFTEVFLRGGRAAGQFQAVQAGMEVFGLPRDDLAAVIDMLRHVDADVSRRLDLDNISEARIIKLLSRAGLIVDGFDATQLRHALDDKTVLERLSA